MVVTKADNPWDRTIRKTSPLDFEALLLRMSDKIEIQEDGCWIWTACLSTKGYGQFSVRSGHHRGAHRVLYTIVVEPVPVELDLDHLCRNRACVNPDHLEPVTRSENLRRGIGVGGVRGSARTHCVHGHEYTAENTCRDGQGHRSCRACRREADHRYYERKKVAAHA